MVQQKIIQRITFTSPGTYRVVLEVSNARGWDATSQEIIVQGNQQGLVFPVADFEADPSNGLMCSFLDSSQNANKSTGPLETEPIQPSSVQHHIYSKAGNYSVHLTVSNDNGTSTTSNNDKCAREQLK